MTMRRLLHLPWLLLLLLFASLTTATPAANSCDATVLPNAALIFLKPHANTPAARDLVRQTLAQHDMTVVTEREITAKTIEQRKLIDQHYYAIGEEFDIERDVWQSILYNC